MLSQLPVAPLRPRKKAEVEAVDWALVLAAIVMGTMVEARAVEAERVAELSSLRSRLARNSRARSRQGGEASAMSAISRAPSMREMAREGFSGANATAHLVGSKRTGSPPKMEYST